MKKSLIALALGTLALGITEFVMMGILPDVATSMGVSIPEAGRLISAYAIGVCCGAPMLTVVHKYPPKSILLFLGALMLAGAMLSVMAQNYYMLLAARFISGLPHGAYFGVASIVAVRLADDGHKTGAVSIMIAGMTVANLLGVPLGTALSSSISWRCPFVLVALCSLLVIYYLWKWVPYVEPLPDNGFRRQFAFLRSSAPWLILGATMLGNGGIFCWYSYVTPQLIHEGGFTPNVISMLMIAAGFGMVAGNLTSGRVSDKYGPGHVARFTLMITVTSLLLTFALAQYGWGFGHTDGCVHRMSFRRKQSAAVSYPQACSRRRDARRREHTDGIQFWECCGGVARRTAHRNRIGLQLSRTVRHTARHCRPYMYDCVLQKVRTHEMI